MRIGIITMHRVLNFGSALQTFALQKKLRDFGCDSEIIDYEFHIPQRYSYSLSRLINGIIIFFRNALIGFPTERKKKKFQEFYRNNYSLSPKQYTPATLSLYPPRYDIYMTGSDQVWNPKHIGKDTNFFLAFAPGDKKRVSYAASFATPVLDDDYISAYKVELSKYHYISVREETGKSLVKEMTGIDATVCCDPTLLLSSSEWDSIASQSKLKICFKYILVYELTYMFDPYPEVQNIYEYVQQTLGYKVIFLNARKEYAFKRNSKLIKSAGPADFVYLVKHSQFVITSSFHGLVFSLIYRKPLFGIVDKKNNRDSRLNSLLNMINAKNSIIDYKEIPSMDKKTLLKLGYDNEKLNEFITNSTNYLKNCIQ